MRSLSFKKVCIVMDRIPDVTSPRFVIQLDVVRQMGYFMRIVSLGGISETEDFSDYGKVKEQILPLTMSRFQVPQAFLTLIILFIIAPLRSFKTFATMCRMLWRGPERKQILKNFFQAVLLVNLHLIDKEIAHLHTHCQPDAARTVYFATLFTGLNTSFVALPGEVFQPGFETLAEPLKSCGCIFALSNYEKKIIEDKIFGDTALLPEMLCFFNGIDLEKFEFRHFPRPQEPYHLITTGRLNKQKGLDTVLEALKKIQDKGIDFHYTVVGDGSELENLKKQAAKLGLGGQVDFVGLRPRYEIPRLLARADLFVSAPRVLENGEQDSLPLSVKEAMAVGVPVVATDCGVLRELIENEETGILVPAADPDKFADACIALLTDQELRAQIRIKARLRIEGNYDIHKQAEAFNKYVEKHHLAL